MELTAEYLWDFKPEPASLFDSGPVGKIDATSCGKGRFLEHSLKTEKEHAWDDYEMLRLSIHPFTHPPIRSSIHPSKSAKVALKARANPSWLWMNTSNPN